MCLHCFQTSTKDNSRWIVQACRRKVSSEYKIRKHFIKCHAKLGLMLQKLCVCSYQFTQQGDSSCFKLNGVQGGRGNGK